MDMFVSLTVVFTCILFQFVDTSVYFNFASYYGDHMVLQRGPQRAIVWGFGPKPGSDVTVTLSGESPITVKTGVDNIWRVKLAAILDTKPHTIVAMSSAGKIMLKDVLFGDVWLCSGQSNMQITVGQAFNSTQEIADAKNFPNIRLFTVSMETSPWPLPDLKNISESWSLPSNESLNQRWYFSAVCWLFGKRLYKHLNYPIGLVESVWYGTQIEEWMDPPSLKKCGVPTNQKILRYAVPADILYHTSRRITGPEPTTLSVIYNAMIHPLTSMTIYGTIWYQGESNANHSITYSCLFPSMITSWRKLFHNNTDQQTTEQFPFGFVQLSPWRNDSSISTGYPDIRWHQTADYGYVPNKKMPRVFMATALDLPDYTSPEGSIHPRDKQDIADRLLLSALPIAYNKYIGKYQGPFPSRFALIKNNNILITYDEDSSPINVRTRNGFEVCCSMVQTSVCGAKDSTWVSAPISEYDNNTISISISNCASTYVVAIRYAWRESPCPFKKCAVYSVENNLPAPPFLKMVTYPSKYGNKNDRVVIQDEVKNEKLSVELLVN